MAFDQNQLAAARVAGSAPERALVMLHGIYGRGRNLQGIARALVAARPEYACWLIDLPYHGESRTGRHGDTVTGIAADVLESMRARDASVNAILGHSYGGKIALAAARELRSAELQLWIIDSTPEVKPPAGSAWAMLHLIRRLPSRFVSRDEAASAIVAGGFAPGVAQWMTTNLVRDDGGFVWRIDFDAMERLLTGFFETDLWDVVEAPAPGHDIHFVKASQSSAISPTAVERIERAPSAHVHLHVREGGHWIHAESPDVVTELLVKYLPGRKS